MLFKSGNGFIPYLHAGYARINRGSLAGGVGLMFPIHLSQRVAVIPDVSVAALSSRAFNNGTGSVGLSTSATLGVYVSLVLNASITIRTTGSPSKPSAARSGAASRSLRMRSMRCCRARRKR